MITVENKSRSEPWNEHDEFVHEIQIVRQVTWKYKTIAFMCSKITRVITIMID